MELTIFKKKYWESKHNKICSTCSIKYIVNQQIDKYYLKTCDAVS